MPLNDPPDALVELFTNRQHLRPHLKVGEVLEQATSELGCCPMAVERATHWLNLDKHRAIGRLRRGELLQLARSVHRFWHSAAPADVANAPSSYPR